MICKVNSKCKCTSQLVCTCTKMRPHTNLPLSCRAPEASPAFFHVPSWYGWRAAAYVMGLVRAWRNLRPMPGPHLLCCYWPLGLLNISLTERTCVLCTLAACQHVTCADWADQSTCLEGEHLHRARSWTAGMWCASWRELPRGGWVSDKSSIHTGWWRVTSGSTSDGESK